MLCFANRDHIVLHCIERRGKVIAWMKSIHVTKECKATSLYLQYFSLLLDFVYFLNFSIENCLCGVFRKETGSSKQLLVWVEFDMPDLIKTPTNKARSTVPVNQRRLAEHCNSLSGTDLSQAA